MSAELSNCLCQHVHVGQNQGKVGEPVWANLIAEHTDIPGNSILLPRVGIPYSITPPVEVIVVERVHARICTQDVDSGAWTQFMLTKV